MATLAVLTVYIVRHGETEANKDGTIQGQLDTELNEEGLRQAGLLAERLKSVPIHHAFTSDLQRAKKTAEAVLAYHPGVELHERKELRERGLGTLEGTKHSGYVRRSLLQSDPTVETTEQLGQRMLAWWDRDVLPLAKQRLEEMAMGGLFSEPAHVFAASHGGSISVFFNAACSRGSIELVPGVSFTRCWNTSVSVIEVDENLKGRVSMYADISHLLANMVIQRNVDEEQ